MASSARLITPPQEDEIYPYRRVWTSIALECGLLFAVCTGTFVAFDIVGVELPAIFQRLIDALLVLLPIALWLIFSFLREQAVPLPRQRLLTVMIVTALAANALGVPIIQSIFQTDRWLPLADAPTRLIGYVITVGSLQELIKYLVVRYTTFPDLIRMRLDTVAYATASAVGYATVLNAQFALTTAAEPGTLALQVFANMAFHIVASLLVAYGLSELRFATPSPILLPLTVMLGALIYGISIPLRTGLINASFALTGGFTRPLLSLGVSAAVLLAVGASMAFLFERAERAAREARAESDSS